MAQAFAHGGGVIAPADRRLPRPGLRAHRDHELFRAALIRITTQKLLLRDAIEEFRSSCQTLGVADEPLLPNDELLLRAYATLGARSREGLTALEHFEREEAAELGVDMRRALAALKNGWFSVFRIDRLHLDEGLDVFDVLKQKKLHITERSITRQAANGDLLLGWLCEEDGTLTFEGGVGYVQSFIAQPILELAARLRSSLPSLKDEGWKARAAELPIPLLAAIISTRARGGLPAQERILKHNPQLAGIDMRPLWQELSLSYQGLDTDPRL